MVLPPAFIQRQRDINAERGQTWIDALPALIAEFEQRWHITVGAPFGLSYNFVAPARHDNGSQLVLKASAPYLDSDVEADALRLYDGRGAIKLIDRDPAQGMLLLERCLPGDELAALVPGCDDEATAIAADVMMQLWRSGPDPQPFLTLARWTGVLDRLYSIFGGATGPMNKRVIDAAIRLRADLLQSAPETVLLHGDLHHHNILRAQRQPWLAIDPKGIADEKAYEPSSFFYNPLGDWHANVDGPHVIRRRIDIIAERANLDRQRVIGWAVVQGIVSSAWDYEDDSDHGWSFTEQVAAWALDLLDKRAWLTLPRQ